MNRLVVLALLNSHVAADSMAKDGKMKASQIGNMLGHGMRMDHSSMGMEGMMAMNKTGAGTDTGFGGDQMQQTFTKYNSLPLGTKELWATEEWTPGLVTIDGNVSWKCDPHLGLLWIRSGGNTKRTPLVLYTTQGGQPSGVGVDIYGALPNPQMQYAVKVFHDGEPTHHYRINVAFRQGDIMCSGSRDEDVKIGDVVIVNPGGSSTKQIPLDEEQSEKENWVRGSCWDGMGYHRFFDTAGNGKMTWDAENLFPVVAMYNEGKLNAIFFASWFVQQSLTSANQWEPIPLPNYLMCKNTCDPACTFKGTSMFSTMHVYFRDHSQVTCSKDLKCWMKGQGCCPKSDEESKPMIHNEFLV